MTDDELDLLRIFRTLPRKERHRLLSYCYDLEQQTEIAEIREALQRDRVIPIALAHRWAKLNKPRQRE